MSWSLNFGLNLRNLRFYPVALCVMALCSWFALPARAADDFKQLAGSPAEMADLRLPAPATQGLRSKAAMLPIQADKNGTWRVQLPIDDAQDLKMMLLAPHSDNWQLKLAPPDGAAFALRAEATARGITRELSAVTFEGDNFPAEVFTFDRAATGLWTLEVNVPADAGAGTLGYFVISSVSPYRLYSYLDTNETVAGRPVALVASLFDHNADKTASADSPTPQLATPGAPVALKGLTQVAARIQLPNGQTLNVPLVDDGQHHDGAANDGVFGYAWQPTQAGRYLAQITAQGRTPEGQAFLRTTEHLWQVSASRAVLGTEAALQAAGDTLNTRWRVGLPVRGLKAGQKVLAYAEVWGRDAQGQAQPVAWLSGMTRIEPNTNVSAGTSRGEVSTVSAVRVPFIAPLGLDDRWLGLSAAENSYELRQVRLLDPDYLVTLATAGQIALPGVPNKTLARANVRQITEDMRTGPRPALAPVPNAVGGKLMLIHGYCSGSNPWPASQFSNAVVFNDPNANRTHDQFANLIKNFGASLPSFGAVAHSQGGAAALHLYTYYWSGLDYATGSRLIQSVGTPYQGTALAGNLALLGQIFGAGCGSNNNLTYSGASAWLAGIPTIRRAKVYFATTSFTDVWWRYDYCNIATDPFLGDPEDGVTEQAYGQLPGGNNRGHKTGWCHTSGMRDPAQTSDTTRNADMNANAAR